MYRIPRSLGTDIEQNHEKIESFRRQEITAAQLKPQQAAMGVYEQRNDGHYMVRLRCVGGYISPKQLKGVARIAKRARCSHIHLTTRQELQIHGVTLDKVTPILKALKKIGLSTRGGGGDTVRNMLVDERAGLGREVFDPLPYAVELTSLMVAEPDSFNMPRKLKIAFDLSDGQANLSLVQDLGLIPRTRHGERGFRVLLGGSVASSPHKGWQIFGFLPERDLYRATEAAKRFFHLYGDRENRSKARIRHIFYRLGEQQAKRLYYTEFLKLEADPALDFRPTELHFNLSTPTCPPLRLRDGDFTTWRKRYAQRQRQRGLWSIVLPFDNGNASADTFAKIADFIGQFGDDVVRCTLDQNLLLRNIPTAYLGNVYDFAKQAGLRVDRPLIVSRITACTGASTCRMGICNPRDEADRLRAHLLCSDLPLDQLAEIDIKLNGCPNICAQCTWAALGFSGRIIKDGDERVKAYNVWLPLHGRGELNEQVGIVRADSLPLFVEDYLAAYLRRKAAYRDYYAYVQAEGAAVAANLLGL